MFKSADFDANCQKPAADFEAFAAEVEHLFRGVPAVEPAPSALSGWMLISKHNGSSHVTGLPSSLLAQS